MCIDNKRKAEETALVPSEKTRNEVAATNKNKYALQQAAPARTSNFLAPLMLSEGQEGEIVSTEFHPEVQVPLDDKPPAPGIEIEAPNVEQDQRPSVPDPSNYVYDLEQIGDVVTGPGARSDTIVGIGGTLPKLSSDQADSVNKAKKYAMEQSIRMVLRKQDLVQQQQQMASQRTQAQRRHVLAVMCKVYVGNIDYNLKKDTIIQSFLPFGPIVSIDMPYCNPVLQKHKGFAFVEYKIPEAAQLALEQMNNARIGGRDLKVVGCPSQTPQAQPVIDEIQEEAKQYNRIYVASIHLDLTEDDIKSVFEAFGPIIYCKLPPGNFGREHEGYGFIEYESAQAANEAIASMNLSHLGGQFLRVCRAITPPNALLGRSSGSSAMPTAAAVAPRFSKLAPTPTIPVLAPSWVMPGLPTIPVVPPPGFAIPTIASAAPSIIPPPGLAIPQITPNNTLQPLVTPVVSTLPQTVVPPTIVAPSLSTMKRAEEVQLKQQEGLQNKVLDQNEPQTLQQQENMAIKGQDARHLVIKKSIRKVDSRVIILKNMVGPEDVDETLQEGVQEECTKFGIVERVIIHNEKQSEDDDNAEVIVKIFVEFAETYEAENARDALNGRYFGGRMVRASLYDQSLFDHSDLSG